MTVEETIRKYIVEAYLSNDDAGFRNDQDLLLVLNSLQLLRMLIELERLFDVRIDNSEVTPENLGTVERLATFITTKQSQTTGVA